MTYQVKIYAQNEVQSPKTKRNTPLPKRSDALEPAKQTPIYIANAPPLHQEIKRTPDPDIRRTYMADEPAKEKRQIDIVELRRADSTSLDLGIGYCADILGY